MGKRVTIEDIATELGLSRNTVSKAFNNQHNLSPETRQRIINKAKELNYKGFALLEDNMSQPAINKGNIVLLAKGEISIWNFFSSIIKGLEEKISSQGYNLIIAIVKPNEMENKLLPQSINKNNIDGIICVEIFNKEYTNVILDAGIPTVFIDLNPDIGFENRKFNLILMENEYSTYILTKHLVKNGHSEIGFVGDINHCKSFYERWAGFKKALSDSGLIENSDFSITLEDNNPYCEYEWMKEQLLKLKKLPTAFVCANDSIAITVIRVIKGLGLNVPNNIEVVGFDDIPESEIIDPPLTTVRTFKYDLGVRAAESLLLRIEKPDRHSEIIHLGTEIIYRSSTK